MWNCAARDEGDLGGDPEGQAAGERRRLGQARRSSLWLAAARWLCVIMLASVKMRKALTGGVGGCDACPVRVPAVVGCVGLICPNESYAKLRRCGRIVLDVGGRRRMEENKGEVVLPELLDVKQVAGYLGLHRVTVVEFARLGKLPAFKVGREWRFRADAIKQWLDRQGRGAPGGQAEDEFDRLWRRLGEQVDRARVTLADVPYVIAEVRGSASRQEEGPAEGGHAESAGRERSAEAGEGPAGK